MDRIEGESPSVLLLDPDFEHGRRIQELLSSEDIQVTWLTRHLSGLALCDEHDFPLVMATVEGQDIDGMEFCALLRHRQQRRQTLLSAILLIGYDRDREHLAALDPGMDDYLIEPCLNAEIIWRVKRNLRTDDHLGGKRLTSLIPEGVLTGQDFYTFLSKELNRSGRQSDSIGLVVIKVQGWPLLALDYGQSATQVVEDIIIRRIQSLVRTYDDLFRIEQGRYVALLPHSDHKGTRGVVQRIRYVLSNILSSEAFAQDELESFHVEGICVQTDIQVMPQPKGIDAVYAHILHRATRDEFGPSFVSMRVESEGIQIQGDSQQELDP
ncbi:MAG: diguanylate cyclase [Desulfovermiculus sp.]|nr:diguanylate cyclase [Desulfovermiculus sp.]